MPTPESNFSRYVIPDEINPVGDCCICVPVPNSPAYIAQFMGAIWRMSLQTHYERDDAHSGALVAAKWRAIWTELQTMGCCVEQKATNNYNTYIENIAIKLVMLQLYQMYVAASLDVQVAFNNVPDLYDSDPGDTGPEINAREIALCIATKSWVDTMCNAGQSFLVGAVDDVLPLAVGAVAIPIIPIPISLFIGLGVALYSGAAWIELGREDYRNYLACGMLQALQGESTTSRAAFDAAFDNLPVRPPPPELGFQDQARDLIEAWFRAVVNDLENYLAFVSVMGTAMSVAETQEFDDCSCEFWEHTWLDGDNEAADWTITPWNPAYQNGSYNAGQDRFEGFCVEDSANAVRVEIAFSEVVITRVRVSMSWNVLRSTGGDGIDIGHLGDVDFYMHMNIPDTQDFGIADTGVISATEDYLILRASAGNNDCGMGAYAYITKIVINGEGLNPFL